MKKSNLYIFMAALIAGASCKKLDVTPPSNLSTTVFWKSPGDADLALTGIYNTLYASPNNLDQYGPMWFENFSDNSYSPHNLASAQQALIAGLTPTLGGFPGTLYGNAYKGIAAVNAFLPNVGTVLSGDTLLRYRGEALFLRGFNYFLLAETYGNVPLVTADPFTVDYKSKMERSPRADVLKQVESDLDSAIAYLPDSTYLSTKGHVVKATAEGYKLRLLLFEQRWAEAAALASTIIGSNRFSLNPNYSTNFYKPGQTTSPEIMFSVQYQAPTAAHPSSLTIYLIAPGYNDLQGTQDLINEYEPNDPRRTMTFFSPGDGPAQGWPFTTPATGTPGLGDWAVGFYPTKKWIDPTLKNPVSGLKDDQDYVLLRYADVKLMYAEAQNEAVGPDATVYQQVNEVRARVNMPPLAAGLSQADMRTAIRHERRVELALEGRRYFDLRRWGIARQKLNGFAQNPAVPGNTTIYKDNFDYWPIPQAEIDLNNGVLTQNPGY
jgi:hypothetical protein